MKNIRTFVCVALGLCCYAAPILAAVDCQCYQTTTCSTTPAGCIKMPDAATMECKQFCTTLCNTPPDPNPDPPLYDTGCCSYTKRPYHYAALPGHSCNDPGPCLTIDTVFYSTFTTCKYSGGTPGSCLEVVAGGSCQ